MGKLFTAKTALQILFYLQPPVSPSYVSWNMNPVLQCWRPSWFFAICVKVNIFLVFGDQLFESWTFWSWSTFLFALTFTSIYMKLKKLLFFKINFLQPNFLIFSNIFVPIENCFGSAKTKTFSWRSAPNPISYIWVGPQNPLPRGPSCTTRSRNEISDQKRNSFIDFSDQHILSFRTDKLSLNGLSPKAMFIVLLAIKRNEGRYKSRYESLAPHYSDSSCRLKQFEKNKIHIAAAISVLIVILL